MTYFYNPKLSSNGPNHPALSSLYGIDTSSYSVYSYVNSRFWRKQTNALSARFKINQGILSQVFVAFSECGKEGLFSLASQETIAKRIHRSVRTVKRALEALRSSGLVLIFHRYTKHRETRRRTTNHTILKAFSDFIVFQDKNKKKLPTLSDTAAPQFITNNIGKGKNPNNKAMLDLETGELVDYGGIKTNIHMGIN